LQIYSGEEAAREEKRKAGGTIAPTAQLAALPWLSSGDRP